MMPRRLLLAAASLVAALLAVTGCGRSGGAGSGADAARPGPGRGQPAVPPFQERARDLGLDFVHFAGASGAMYYCEIVGSGAGLIDHDQDGDLDVYLVQGHMLPIDRSPLESTFPPPGDPPFMDRLYRNELKETGRLRFTDVTAEVGIRATGYGMGVAVGDADGDGWPDLYVTNLGPNQLWRNRGDGTFEDATESSGTGDERWSTSAAFLDYDRDGHLDLFVTNYVAFSLASNKECLSEAGARDYCGPLSYPPVPDRLFRNEGDGTFADATSASGVARAFGSGLGVTWADFNHDGWPDLYVANDGRANQLWMNRKDGTFSDESLIAGAAYNAEGAAEAGMGVDAADVDGDGDEDLFLTHLVGETNTLYVNDGRGMFADRTAESDLGAASLRYTSFGTSFVDYDNDGWLDILVVNGAVKTVEALARAGDPWPLHQRNQLFHGLGAGRFEEVTESAGAAFALSDVSRGAAFGDLDDDGDVDVLIANNSGPCRLLVNEVGSRNHWLGLRVLDATGRVDDLGARVEIVLPGGRSLWRRVHVAASYCSSNDPRVLFGLADATSVAAVRVHHVDGPVEEWTGLAPDRYHELRRGSGRLVGPP